MNCFERLTATCPVLPVSLLFAILLFSCSGAADRAGSGKPVRHQPDSTRHKPPTIFTDTLFVSGATAVFFKPDTVQMKKYETLMDTMTFASMQHDCFYQQRNARMVIGKQHPEVQIRDAGNARYLCIKQANGKREWMDLDSINDPCGILFANGRKKPQLVDMMNIDTDAGFYFNR